MMGKTLQRTWSRTILMKSFVLLIIVLLSGGSVAVAGPIGFIGIVTRILPDFLLGSITDGEYRIVVC